MILNRLALEKLYSMKPAFSNKIHGFSWKDNQTPTLQIKSGLKRSPNLLNSTGAH
jgi:hypothetical protein